MSKKCFAAIREAQEVMAKIETLANEAAQKPALACKNAKEINEIAGKRWRISAREAARRLDISPQTFLNWINNNVQKC